MSAKTVEKEAVEIDIISREVFLNQKLSFDLRVSRRISKEDLERVAKRIYIQSDGSLYTRIFICWYLPGMKVNIGAWATTHFNPNLKVEIMEFMLDSNPTTLKKIG